ncbi:MAG TPA: L-threonylcarbamoyladenylate synthase [Acidimicrobiales bacterium]|nr:L-threonylcarbamoyladenylate synthase [Acidimicrobiales bacterium]
MTQRDPVRVVPARGAAGVAAAAAALEAGGLIALPTDTVYGLAARVDRPRALAAIFVAKGRPAGLALPVLVGRWRQVHAVAAEWPRSASMLAARFWPGPLTVVVPARPEIGRALGGDGTTVGVRRPAHRFVRALCIAAGPLAVTSANRHGQPPCVTVEEVLAAFAEPAGPGGPGSAAACEGSPAPPGALSLVVDGGRCDGLPSTVVDCTRPSPRCLREGAVPWAWVEAAAR